MEMKVPHMTKNATVLMVEDNPDDEALILRSLRRANLKNDIVVTRDGAEALDYLFFTGAYTGSAPKQLPVVVLLDLKLPKIDGLEVLRRMRTHELTKLVPTIVLSSSDEEQDIADSYRFGANSYVQKPVRSGDFTAAVQELGLYWLLLNKPPASAKREWT